MRPGNRRCRRLSRERRARRVHHRPAAETGPVPGASIAGSRQRISISSTSMPAREPGGSRTISFAVVTSRAFRRAAVSRSRSISSAAVRMMVRESPAFRRAAAPSGATSRRTSPAGRSRQRRRCGHRRTARRSPAPRRPATPGRTHRSAPAVWAHRRAARPRRRGRARRDRLAQRPGRDHPAVAEAVAGIDDDQRQILGETRVLEPVIEQDRLRAGRDRGARCRRPGRGQPSTARARPATALRRRPQRHRAGPGRPAPGPPRLPP